MLSGVRMLFSRVWAALTSGLGEDTKAVPGGLSKPLREAYSSYNMANRRWLEQFCDLTIKMKPELEAVARLKFGIQLAYLDRRDARFEYLSSVHPERLHRSSDLTAFVGSVDASWREEDTLALSHRSPQYRQLEATIDHLLSEDPQRSDLFREQLAAASSTQEYADLLKEFMREINVIEERSPLKKREGRGKS